MKYRFRNRICVDGVQLHIYKSNKKTFQADASDQNRYTSRPNTIFCKSLAAMRTLQTSLSLRDGRAASLLNSKACGVAETGVVVYIVQEEKDVVRVQFASSGKYFWVSRKALR